MATIEMRYSLSNTVQDWDGQSGKMLRHFGPHSQLFDRIWIFLLSSYPLLFIYIDCASSHFYPPLLHFNTGSWWASELVLCTTCSKKLLKINHHYHFDLILYIHHHQYHNDCLPVKDRGMGSVWKHPSPFTFGIYWLVFTIMWRFIWCCNIPSSGGCACLL